MTGDEVMPEEKRSFEFERAILEASALLVTLLFIILQLGENWKNPEHIAAVSFLSVPFVVSAMLAAIIMYFGGSSGYDLGELASMLTRGLRALELVSFGIGLLGLSLLLYNMTAVFFPPYGLLYLYFAAIVGTSIVIMVVALLIIYRRYRKKA